MDKNYLKLVWFVALIGIIANIFDLITTYIALQYEFISEVNPFMAFFLRFGVFGYIIKLVLGTWIFLPFKYCPSYPLIYSKLKWHNFMIILAWIFVISMFLVLGVNNLLILRVIN